MTAADRAEAVERIMQEISSCNGDWKRAEAVLWEHRAFYYALSPRERERLNEQIKDAMNGR